MRVLLLCSVYLGASVLMAQSMPASPGALEELRDMSAVPAVWTRPVFAAFMKMISKNLERDWAPPENPDAPEFDLEEDAPTQNKDWNHQILVYEALVKMLESPTSKLECVTGTWLATCDSVVSYLLVVAVVVALSASLLLRSCSISWGLLRRSLTKYGVGSRRNAQEDRNIPGCCGIAPR